MKRLVFILIFLPCVAFGAEHNLADCEYTTIDNFINHATPAGFIRGDTVVCPADTATWSTTLPLTTGIIFKGAGAGSTVITTTADPAIEISPDATMRSSDERLEIDGMTFNGSGYWVTIENENTDEISNFIVGNCSINGYGRTFNVTGNVYGLVYSNTINPNGWLAQFLGYEQDSWQNHTTTYGTTDQFWFEDNTITGNSYVNSGHGSRYAMRYNTFISQGEIQHFDFHGNVNSTCSHMIGEVYGNIYTNISSFEFVYQRGGQLLVHNNRFSGTSSLWIDISELTDDSASACFGLGTQHVNNSYYWNIHDDGGELNTTPGTDYTISDCCDAIDEDVDYFLTNPAGCTTSNCQSGIGQGSAVPTGNCLVGTAYWVTSYSPASTPPTTMADMKTYTQAGRLWKCTSTNVWELFYTPLDYPHPLRGEETPVPANAIQGMQISNLNVTNNLIAWHRTDGLR